MKAFWVMPVLSIFAAAGCATPDANAPGAVAETKAAETKAPEPEPETEPVQVAKSDEDKMICRRQEVTGTRFLKRICMTQEEWDLTEERAEETARQLDRNRRAQSGCSSPNC